MSRTESREFVDAMLREASDRKKRSQENTRDSIARNLNRLAEREKDLEINVQNLTWKKRRLETETQALEINKARIEQSNAPQTWTPGPSTEQATTTKASTPGLDVLYRSFPSPTSTIDDPMSPSTLTPRTHSYPLPLPSSYEPFLNLQENTPQSIKTHRPIPSPIQHQQYVPQYIFSPQNLPVYIPSTIGQRPVPIQHEPYIPQYVSRSIGPIRTTKPGASKPIETFQDRSGAYWRRLKIVLHQKNLRGKRRIENPEDNGWFEYKSSREGSYRIRIDGGWYDIDEGCSEP